MQIIIVRNSQGETAPVACPHCGLEYPLPTQGSERGHIATVRCSCGENFLAVINTRQFERKSVAINGVYTVLSDSGIGGLVTLRDISEGGVGFTLTAPQDLQPGWLVTLVFDLNNGKEKHVIVAKANIRSINGLDVGCSFLNPERVRQDIIAYCQHCL